MMAYTKCLLVVGALALALGQASAWRYNSHTLDRLDLTCRAMDRTMYELKEIRADAQRSFDFGKNWLQQNTERSSLDRKLIKAWEAVLKGEECSSASWQNVVLLGYCSTTLLEGVLKEPMKAYATKCLGFELNDKIKAQVSGLFSKKVDFLSDDFINNYNQENPDERPLHVNKNPERQPMPVSAYKGPVGNCCNPKKSAKSLIQTIERDFAAKGQDAKKEFYANMGKFDSYMTKKLYKPCTSYKTALEPLKDEIEVASKYYEGDQEALLATLDQEAKNILFRFKYCAQMSEGKKAFLEVAKHFV